MKFSTENYDVRRVAIAILHYWRDHPSAKDSTLGIAKWWVGEERNVAEKALALLVKEGVIEKRRHIYQVAVKKTAHGKVNCIEKTLQRLQKSANGKTSKAWTRKN